MNLQNYFTIIIAFAIGYILGTLTSRLLKFFVGFVVIAAILVGLYLYYLR